MSQRSSFALALLASLAAGAAAAAPAARTLAAGVAHDALFAIAFDGDVGLAAGAPGRILATRDGGRSWAQDRAFPSALAMLGADLEQGRAIIVGQMGEIHLRDASGAWSRAQSGTRERLLGVSLNRSGLALAVGAFGTLLKSPDHGKTWQLLTVDWTPFLTEDQVMQGIQPHMYAVDVDDAGLLTIAGEFGLILRSADGGSHWHKLSAHTQSGEAAIFALELRRDGVGYAVGQDGLVLQSHDGGAHWTQLSLPSKANLLGVRSAGARVVISAMHDMLVSRDGASSWQRVDSPAVQSGWFSAVGVSGERFVAVGHAGHIVQVDQ